MRPYRCAQTIERYSVAYNVEKLKPNNDGFISWFIYNEDDIPFDDTIIVAHQVFQDLEKYLYPIKFQHVKNYEDAQIKIFFVPQSQKIDIKLPNGDTFQIETPYVFDGSGGNLALAFMPFPGSTLRGVILFDEDEKWGLSHDEKKDQIDFHTVFLHEVLHVLGIRHSEHEHAVMYASYDGEKRELTVDDKMALIDLYKDHISKKTYYLFKIKHFFSYNWITKLFLNIKNLIFK